MTRISWIVQLDDDPLRTAVDGLRATLTAAGHEESTDGSAEVVLVWADRPLPAETLAASRGESLGATIAAVLENVIDTEDRVTHAVRGVQIDPKSGLLSVSGGPLRRAAEVRSLAYDE